MAHNCNHLGLLLEEIAAHIVSVQNNVQQLKAQQENFYMWATYAHKLNQLESSKAWAAAARQLETDVKILNETIAILTAKLRGVKKAMENVEKD